MPLGLLCCSSLLADCKSGLAASYAHGLCTSLPWQPAPESQLHLHAHSTTHALLQVLTNTASIEKAPPAAEVDTMWSDGSASPTSVLDIGAKPASHKLVVRPRFDYQHGSHGCPLCPANLCKVGRIGQRHPLLAGWHAGTPLVTCRSVSIGMATHRLQLWGCAASESQHSSPK